MFNLAKFFLITISHLPAKLSLIFSHNHKQSLTGFNGDVPHLVEHRNLHRPVEVITVVHIPILINGILDEEVLFVVAHNRHIMQGFPVEKQYDDGRSLANGIFQVVGGARVILSCVVAQLFLK